MFPHLDAPISPVHRDALSFARLHQVRAYLTLHPSVVPFPCLFLLASFPSNRYTLCGLSLHGTSPRCIPRGPPLDIVTPRCIRVSLAISSLSLSLSPLQHFFSLSLKPSSFPSFPPTAARSFFGRLVAALFPSYPLCSPSLAVSPSLSLEGYPLCFDQTFFRLFVLASSRAGNRRLAPRDTLRLPRKTRDSFVASRKEGTRVVAGILVVVLVIVVTFKFVIALRPGCAPLSRNRLSRDTRTRASWPFHFFFFFFFSFFFFSFPFVDDPSRTLARVGRQRSKYSIVHATYVNAPSKVM